MTTDLITDDVRRYYGDAARTVLDRDPATAVRRSCCAPDGDTAHGEILYDADQRASLPEAAVLASLGCGNPTAVAELRPARPSSTSVRAAASTSSSLPPGKGRTGYAYGLDMTDEMLELARRNATEAGATNVEFRRVASSPSRSAMPPSTWSSATAS